MHNYAVSDTYFAAKGNFYKPKALSKPNNKDNVIFEILDYFDKDIKDLILENYILAIGDGKDTYTFKLWQWGCGDCQKKFSLIFKKALLCLAEQLQEIKDRKEIPDFIKVLKNLKKEGRLQFRFYITEPDWERACLDLNLPNSAGIYDGKSLNAVKLPVSNKPDSALYYHELIHAIDDGKLMTKNEYKKYNIDNDYLSTNQKASDLAKKMDLYREKTLEKWKEDAERFINFKNNSRRCNLLRAQIDCKTASAMEKLEYIKLRDECAREERYFNSEEEKEKFWFYGCYSIDRRWGELKRGKEGWPPLPHALENNRELIASALTVLKYGSENQYKKIREDNDLMTIIRQWKEFKPR